MKVEILKRIVLKEEFVAVTQGLESALLLSQLCYWSERVRDFDQFIEEECMAFHGSEEMREELKTHGWIRKSAAQFAKEMAWALNARSIHRHLSKLVELKIVDKRKRYNPKYKFDRACEYRVNFCELQSQLKKLGYTLSGYRVTGCFKSSDDMIGQNDQSIGQNDQSMRHDDESIGHGDLTITENIVENTIENITENIHDGPTAPMGEGVTRVTPPTEPPERTEIPRETRSFALEEFITFWQAYPRKVAKHHARRAWEKHQPKLDEVLPALERAKQEWNDPKYIPHPATWINGRRWEDEVEEDQSEPSPLDGREEEFWSWLQATRPWEKRRHTSMIPQKFIDEFLEGGNQREEKPFVFNNLKQEIATEEGVENF